MLPLQQQKQQHSGEVCAIPHGTRHGTQVGSLLLHVAKVGVPVSGSDLCQECRCSAAVGKCALALLPEVPALQFWG